MRFLRKRTLTRWEQGVVVGVLATGVLVWCLAIIGAAYLIHGWWTR